MFCQDSSTKLYAVRIDSTSLSSPKGYFHESSCEGIVCPIALLKDSKLITGNGDIYTLNISVKEGDTNLKSDWCKDGTDNYYFTYNFLFTDGSNYIWFVKNNKIDCYFEERAFAPSRAKSKGTQKKYEGETGIGLYSINIKINDSKSDKKIYFITNTTSTNCVNFHVPLDEFPKKEE